MKASVIGLLLLLFLSFTLSSTAYVLAASPDGKAIEAVVNGYRKSHGLKPLRENLRLRESSTVKAVEMVAEGYFDHTSPMGAPFYTGIRKAEYSYSEIGEVIARGCESEKCFLDTWATSPVHRQIILNPRFQDIGCGSQAAGPDDHYFAVCHFGRPPR